MKPYRPSCLRVSEPPPEPTPRGSWSAVRQFIQAAQGKWCIIVEHPSPGKRERKRLRSRAWSGLRRFAGFELKAVTDDGGVFRVYARYVGGGNGDGGSNEYT